MKPIGLLGSNKATEESVKLFPRDCGPVVEAIQHKAVASAPASMWK